VARGGCNPSVLRSNVYDTGLMSGPALLLCSIRPGRHVPFSFSVCSLNVLVMLVVFGDTCRAQGTSPGEPERNE
jgi:hypothetical protein